MNSYRLRRKHGWLNKEAEDYANKKLARKFENKDQNSFTLSPEDKEYRDSWWIQYNECKERISKRKNGKYLSCKAENKVQQLVVAKPEFFEGAWIGKKYQRTQYVFFDDEVTIHFKTKNIPKGTKVKIEIFEDDVNWLKMRSKEQLDSIEVTLDNSEHNHQLKLKKEWNEDDSDGVTELYFKLSAEVYGKTIEKSFPENSDDYLLVIQKGVWVSVIIKNPNFWDELTDKNFVGSIGLAGHTAICIGEDFYDFGPFDPLSEGQYQQFLNEEGELEPESEWYAKANPWWEGMAFKFLSNKQHDIYSPKGKKLEKTNLKNIDYSEIGYKQVFAFLRSHLGIVGHYNIYSIRFLVTEDQADTIRTWWKNRYNNFGIYSINPAEGEQCTTTVRISLQEAGVLPNMKLFDAIQTPSQMLNVLKLYVTCQAGIIDNKSAKGRGVFTEQWCANDKEEDKDLGWGEPKRIITINKGRPVYRLESKLKKWPFDLGDQI